MRGIGRGRNLGLLAEGACLSGLPVAKELPDHPCVLGLTCRGASCPPHCWSNVLVAVGRS